VTGSHVTNEIDEIDDEPALQGATEQ
jgi:hypothetical protein